MTTPTQRTPKLGEVWTAPNRDTYACCVATPDRLGRYGWSGRWGTFYAESHLWTPPSEQPT